jgi:tRNA A37 threonylcarbamoyladenosine biosynthesis protein TsaE
MFENREETNTLAGNICIAIAKRFMTNGAMGKGKTNAVKALIRETL